MMCDKCKLYQPQYKDMEMHDIMRSGETLKFPLGQVRIIHWADAKLGWRVESVTPRYCPHCGERIGE